MLEKESTIKILAPGGDINSIKAAILAKADAIYCGLKDFNARKRAENLSFKELEEVVILAHQNNCKIYLTFNTIIFENEIKTVKEILSRLTQISIDGIIVQDWGVFLLLKEYFPSISVHASTQTTTHNKGQIEFLANLGVKQINFCRELSIKEIEELSSFCKKFYIKPEVFVHGALCISFSGQCYMSKVLYNRSGNRGECVQPCRMLYLSNLTNKKGLFLNLKDLSAFKKLKSLIDAGVKIFKIEGRLRNRDYVYIVTKSYKKQLENILKNNYSNSEEELLYKVFNRSYTSGYLDNKISKEMFSDTSADKSLILLGKVINYTARNSIIEIDQNIEIPYNTPIRIYSKGFTFVCTANIKSKIDKNRYFLQITNKLKGKIKRGDYIYKKSLSEIDSEIEKGISKLQIAKKKIAIFVEGKKDQPMKITFVTATRSITLSSSVNLVTAEKHPLTKEVMENKLGLNNHLLFEISSIDCSNLESNLFLPINEITNIKHTALEILSKNKKMSEEKEGVNTTRVFNLFYNLNFSSALLIDNIEDLSIPITSSSRFILEMPPAFDNNLDNYIELFKNRSEIIPYFTSILISKHYEMSIKLLNEVKPPLIITDNTGIGWEATKNGIPWIAGPFLNIANSLSAKCLMKYGGCKGTFFSSELSTGEIKRIYVPEGFSRWYFYSPFSFLMSTRQCIIKNCENCKKELIDEDCLNLCNKFLVFKLQGKDIFVIKRKGFYTQLYFKKPFSFNNTSFNNNKNINGEVYVLDQRFRKHFS